MTKARRGATDLCGVIAVDKPEGMTSHDVVDALRRLTGEGRIGHAGTLDPMATGLLLVCIGPAARLSELLMAGDKVYQARIRFGAATDTDDAQGVVIASAPLVAKLSDEQFALEVLAGFLGAQEQLPPRFAAIKKDGQKAYVAARKGLDLELEPRTITVHGLRLLEVGAEHWDVEACVSKGAYIRALARDIGEAVGSKAHLASLRRLSCGTVTLAQAHTLKELEQAVAVGGRGIKALFLDLQTDLGITQELLPEGLRNAL
ncbi:MAG: tRNA pseudouridine(55) synthase TruB [Coriobacteriia bacterium]|nr:tRNA pseudouridine(55) synthase TruB [Coriobacteriia bacterium]